MQTFRDEVLERALLYADRLLLDAARVGVRNDTWGRLADESDESFQLRSDWLARDVETITNRKRYLTEILGPRKGTDGWLAKVAQVEAELAEIDFRWREWRNPDLLDLRARYPEQEFRFGVVLPSPGEMDALMKVADQNRSSRQHSVIVRSRAFVAGATILVLILSAAPMPASLRSATLAIVIIWVGYALVRTWAEFNATQLEVTILAHVLNYVRRVVMRLGPVIAREVRERDGGEMEH